tara:strand:+ start:1359 stop:1487 length:129 start_codon:yes stop_codon:yes gene_type:complete
MTNLEKLIEIKNIFMIQTTPGPSDDELLEYLDVLIAIEKEYV